jgi:hypothetical protein
MVENPRSTWIVHHDERLRIVPEDLWLTVKHPPLFVPRLRIPRRSPASPA